MLAYAAHSIPRRDSARPKLLVPIVAGHLAVIAIVMTARMEVPTRTPEPPLVIKTIRIPPPPPPNPEPKKVEPYKPPAAAQTVVQKVVDIPRLPTVPDSLPPRTVGNVEDGVGPVPINPPFIIQPPHQIVRTGPKLATAEDMLRPPYPAAKRDAGEEAALALKLTIDAHGRVIAVESVGKADPAFLASARAHLLRAWHFEPATEDGKPVASVKTITLRFELGEG